VGNRWFTVQDNNKAAVDRDRLYRFKWLDKQ
jgi:hypothetical protein